MRAWIGSCITAVRREAMSPSGGGMVFLLLAPLVLVLFLPGLGTLELRGEEERRVLPAVEMLRTGDWLQPMLGGEPYRNKPPLVNWLVAASFELTGVANEWSARLPSVLGLFVLLGVVAFGPGDRFTPRARLLTGLLFLTSVGVLEKGRLVELEALLVSLTGAACLWWWLANLDGCDGWTTWSVPAICLAAGLLLKGPAIVYFFGGTVAVVLFAERRLRTLFTPAPLLAATFAGGCFLAWYLPATAATPRSAGIGSLYGDGVYRFVLGWTEVEGFGAWLRVAVRSCVGLLPWGLFLPLLWNRDLLDGLDERTRRAVVGARWAVVVTFVPMAVLPGVASRYGLPVLPTLCVLLGIAFDRVAPDERGQRSITRLAVLAVVGTIVAWCVTPSLTGLAVVAAAVVLAFGLRRSPLLLNERLGRAWAVAGLAAVGSLAYATFVLPIRAERERYRPTGAAVTRLVPDGAAVHIFRPGSQEFVFYVDRPVKYVLDESTIDSVPPEGAYLAIRRDDLRRLKPALWNREVEELHVFDERIAGEFRLVRVLPRTLGHRTLIARTP